MDQSDMFRKSQIRRKTDIRTGTHWFSSACVEWETPQRFFIELHQEFGFSLDPCASFDNAKCAFFYTQEDDGLNQNWAPHTVFMNPPYGRTIGDWMRKAFIEFQKGATVVCLVPARTDTAWWHDYAIKGEIRFIRGRLNFGGTRNHSPFPSAVVIFKGSGK